MISSIASATSSPIRMTEKATAVVAGTSIWRRVACDVSCPRREFHVQDRIIGLASRCERLFYTGCPRKPAPDRSDPWRRSRTPNSIAIPTSRSSTGRRPADDLVERAVELGLSGLAVTDHNGLYGAVRFVAAAEAAGLHPVVGIEIELLRSGRRRPGRPRRPAPPRRGDGAGRRTPATLDDCRPSHEGLPARPRPERARLPGPSRPGQGGPPRHRRAVARAASRPARPVAGRLAEPVPAAVARQPRRDEGRAAVQPGAARRAHRGPRRAVGLSRRRDRPAAAGRRSGRRTGRRRALRDARSGGATAPATSGFFIELSHHLLPDDDWLVPESAALAEDLGLPVVVTNDVHYAQPRGPRVPRRPDRDPARPDARHARPTCAAPTASRT